MCKNYKLTQKYLNIENSNFINDIRRKTQDKFFHYDRPYKPQKLM